MEITKGTRRVLEMLLNGENKFHTNWNGERVVCKVLQIDLVRNLVHVRFDKDVTKKVTDFVDQPFSPDIDPPQIMVEKEITIREEWLST